MEFTLSQAAKEAGISKSTLSKALSTGRVSGERLPGGSFRIDASELFRVFPKRTEETKPGTGREQDRTVSGRPEAEIVLIQLRLQMAEDQLARERELRDQERGTSQETVADLRRRLDRAEERVLALSAAQEQRGAPAPAPVEASSVMPPDTPKARRGFLARLLDRS